MFCVFAGNYDKLMPSIISVRQTLIGMAAIHKLSTAMGALGVVVLRLLVAVIVGFNGEINHSAMAQVPGFVSIDCGANSNYTDAHGISWTSDSYMNSVGHTANVSTGNMQPAYTTLRYFQGNQRKYCYSLSTLPNINSYLVRASFWYGSSSTPVYPTPFDYQINFTLLINSDEWANISISLPQHEVLVHEINLQLIIRSSPIAVCLSGASPFISSLELRPLYDQSMTIVQHMSQTGLAMRTIRRVNYGALPSDAAVRYPDDFVDRVWIPDTATPRLVNSTPYNTTLRLDQPPRTVLLTAYVSPSPTTPLDINVTVDDIEHQYAVAFYFWEIDARVNASRQRVFQADFNGQSLTESIDVFGTTNSIPTEFTFDHLKASEFVDFNLRATPTSIYPPFLAAFELFQHLDKPLSPGTSAGDILSINNITKTFVNLSSYTGDPCLPSGYGYPWLNCTSATPPRISVLSLSHYGLVGAIPESINNLTGLVEVLLDDNRLDGSIPDLSALTSLQKLNLSSNRLSGAIPDSLSTLQHLKELDLQDNDLSGIIPAALFLKPGLYFNYAGNPHLCLPNNASCDERSQATQNPGHLGLIIGLLISCVVLIGIISTFIYCFKMKQAANKHSSSRSTKRHQLEDVIQQNELVEASNMITVFGYRDLELATDYFSKRLGEGGFGPVYQGKLENGRPVAIKVLSGNSGQGSRQFLNEVALLSRVHHKNIVRLLGYCTEQKPMLLYEFMSNGSLRNILYGPSSLIAPLSWETRLMIMVDIAQGLEYLHHGCNPPIIHRDVKCSNILLNDKMEAKIGDFGISRLTNDKNDIVTSLMGSLGYLDPEYGYTLKLTEKADIYSFGVLLLEIVCGRPPFKRNISSKRVHITQWVRQSIEQGIIEDIVDKSIHNNYNMSSMWKVVELAMKCVQGDRGKRPNMGEVCIELKDALHMELHGSLEGPQQTMHLLEVCIELKDALRMELHGSLEGPQQTMHLLEEVKPR